MIYDVELAGASRTVEVVRDGSAWKVRVDGGPWQAIAARQHGNTWWIDPGTGPQRLHLSVRGERVAALRDGVPLLGSVVDPRAHALDAAMGGAEGRLVTEMPGAIVRVPVAVGDAVREGQVIVVVEAMKMENEFKAPFDGTVVEVAVAPGQAVDGGTLLAVLEPTES